MAATIAIEEERGTYVGSRHPHNGYYAGDFRNVAPRGNGHLAVVRVVTISPATR